MDSPRHLIEQTAKERSVSVEAAKRALYLKALAEDGRSVREAMDAFGIAASTVKMLCRKFTIDLTDYRPYAAWEKRGEPRPTPVLRDIHLAADGLPLFSA